MMYRNGVFAVALLLAQLGSTGIMWAQRPSGPPQEMRGGRQQRDPLAPLKRALNDSGAAPLSAAQEEQIIALITARRSALVNRTPNAVLASARQAYETAILNGSLGAAEAQADLIANEMANATRTLLKATAKFQIDVLAVLRTNPEQFNLLSAHIGAAGLSRLLASLSGGPGVRGGPGGFPGRGVDRRAPPPRNQPQ